MNYTLYNSLLLDDIVDYFDKNFLRLRNLMALYSTHTTGRGRKSDQDLDLLRSTIVLAHATLEDYLRSVLIWKLPFVAQNTYLNQVPLLGTSTAVNRKTKFDLGELAIHRGKTVDDVINASIIEHVGLKSFNSTSEIAAALESIKVNVTGSITGCFSLLDDMIKRRHNIVHRADRDEKRPTGSGNHAYKSISLIKVKSWINEIDTFVNEVNRQLR